MKTDTKAILLGLLMFSVITASVYFGVKYIENPTAEIEQPTIVTPVVVQQAGGGGGSGGDHPESAPPAYVPSYFWCYQESANVTDTDDGVALCGLRYTGTYAFSTTNWTDPEDAFDGSIITYGDAKFPSNATIYINYSKPEYATNDSKWVVADGNLSLVGHLYQNYSLQHGCWNFSSTILKLRVNSMNITNRFASNWSCYNGSTWYSIRSSNDKKKSGRIVEEWMQWRLYR